MTFAKSIPLQFVQLTKKRRNWVVIGALLLVAVIVLSRGCGSTTTERNVYFNARRGPFEVSITEGGSLRAVNEVIVRCELEGTSRIIKIVPEGTTVSKGDLLVELDSSDLRDRLIQQEVVCESSQFSYDQAALDLAIQKSVFESNVKDAELRLTLARSDREKYEEGDWPQQKKVLESKIIIAKEELQRAQTRLDWTEQLFKRDFATKTDLEADKLSLTRTTITLDQAEEELRLSIKFDNPKKLLVLKSNEENALKELERVKQRGEANIAQYEANLISRKRHLDLQNEKLSTLKQQLELTKILAPQDGLVVYPFTERWSNSGQIEEGATVRQRQEIIKLPDISQMLVDLKVHESYVNQIRPGLSANVTIDSLPDSHFKGVVRKIAPLPDTQSRYSNPNLKVYSTEVLIQDERLPNIKPGVSARAEIIITNLEDVITVPIQAVTTLKGQQVCYLEGAANPVPTPVEVGLFNDKFIEIKKGLREKDRVLLSPPSASEATEKEEKAPAGRESPPAANGSAVAATTESGGTAKATEGGSPSQEKPAETSSKKKRKTRPPGQTRPTPGKVE